MPFISGGGGGGPAAGSYLPMASPAGVTVDTTTYTDTIARDGTKLATLVAPWDRGLLAVAVTGDLFPRWVFAAAGSSGIYGGDGTTDPVLGTNIGNLNFSAGGEVFINGAGSAFLNVGVANTNVGASVEASPALKVGAGVFIQSGANAPTVGGNVGDIFIRTNGGALTTIYRCTVAGTAGNATWAGIL